jgi:hypothetical protein
MTIFQSHPEQRFAVYAYRLACRTRTPISSIEYIEAYSDHPVEVQANYR